MEGRQLPGRLRRATTSGGPASTGPQALAVGSGCDDEPGQLRRGRGLPGPRRAALRAPRGSTVLQAAAPQRAFGRDTLHLRLLGQRPSARRAPGAASRRRSSAVAASATTTSGTDVVIDFWVVDVDEFLVWSTRVHQAAASNQQVDQIGPDPGVGHLRHRPVSLSRDEDAERVARRVRAQTLQRLVRVVGPVVQQPPPPSARARSCWPVQLGDVGHGGVQVQLLRHPRRPARSTGAGSPPAGRRAGPRPPGCAAPASPAPCGSGSPGAGGSSPGRYASPSSSR